MISRTSGRWLFGFLLVIGSVSCSTMRPAGRGMSGNYDVRAYGASGDGVHLDTLAVNRAIDSANHNGGGTVVFPSGVYLCHSIHLKSDVTLYIGAGATIMAAPPAAPGSSDPTYDMPEPNEWHEYQDFGHDHWHNSLIWGENLQNISIIGPGMIDGSKGLVRTILTDRKHPKIGDGLYSVRPTTTPTTTPATRPTSRGVRVASTTSKPTSKSTSKPKDWVGEGDHLGDGLGNKSIALKLCKNVTLKDFTVRCGGHFAILATGVDNCVMDHVTLDTNRDGVDLDCCRHVTVSNCFVNSPSDDGICPKSSYALGYPRSSDDIAITNCHLSGYACGTFIDGTYKLLKNKYDEEVGGVGRIKCGTESNGGFRNLTVSNCTFDWCRGIALESVDGALLEDVSIDNITMRHLSTAPIFLRLGARLRGPKESTTIGTLQRINISNIVVYDADTDVSSSITGLPGEPVRDVKLSNIQIHTRGGAATYWATTRPAENPKRYPEPNMFGQTPSYAFFIRHVEGIDFDNVTIRYDKPETRPPFVLQDVKNVNVRNVDAATPADVAPFTLRQVKQISTMHDVGIADGTQESVDDGQLGSGHVPQLDPPDQVDEEPITP